MELLPKNVSVIIPTLGKRTEELKAITSHLNGLGFEDVLIITEDGNRLYNRRFGACRAIHEWIYTQDDDVIVENVLELLKEAEKDKIVANTQPEHTEFYAKEENGGGRICLIGWGGIFHKDLLDDVDKYLAKFPKDELFLREFDRVFTYIHDIKLIQGKLKHFDSANDEGQAMYREKRHWDDLKAIINNLKQL
jgi:hypothetical protein